MRGAWIEMSSYPDVMLNQKCRSPCGERGLKFGNIRGNILELESLPVRGAWIEIHGKIYEASASQSLPVRGAWIEIVCYTDYLVQG